MLTFAPLTRTDDYVTLSFSDLCRRYDYGGPLGSLYAALRSGDLNAYVQIEGDGRFWHVPSAHWNKAGSSLEGEPSEELFCWGSSDVPAQFRDRPLLFFLDDVVEWESGTGELDCHSYGSASDNGIGARSDEKEWVPARELFQKNPNHRALDAKLMQLFDHGLLRIRVRSAILKVRWKERRETDWIIHQTWENWAQATRKSASTFMRINYLLPFVTAGQERTWSRAFRLSV